MGYLVTYIETEKYLASDLNWDAKYAGVLVNVKHIGFVLKIVENLYIV